MAGAGVGAAGQFPSSSSMSCGGWPAGGGNRTVGIALYVHELLANFRWAGTRHTSLRVLVDRGVGEEVSVLS
ncbi:hypothetical protein Heshes_17450 [Alicyclobacillus hesperidum]|uniref:Uncharacterized protein n=1 Tax=Alicyclobacillus hesperidum TaxID=89784 RepID=A0AA37X1L6_9BACL|nr:hypothetical protein Heshes_17450 [Alicyclobacillus hesperidum]